MKLTWVVGRRNSEGGQKEESDSDSFVEHGGYDLCGLESCWSEVAFTRLIYKTSGFPEISGPVKRTVRSMEQCIKTRTKLVRQKNSPITSHSHQRERELEEATRGDARLSDIRWAVGAAHPHLRSRSSYERFFRKKHVLTWQCKAVSETSHCPHITHFFGML